jgi:serine/threonine-protein kinase
VATLSALAVLAVVALVVGLILRNGAGEEPKAPTTATMPDLRGKSAEQAQALLSEARLGLVNPGQDKSDCSPKEKVSKQSPAAGETVQLAQTVTYDICVGPDPVRVPSDLKGIPQGSAVSRLQGLGLDPKVVQVDGTAAEGTVVDVEKEGQEVKPGTEITVTVSKGNQSGVPNVVGETEQAADGILRRAGFKVRVELGDITDNPGIVVRQNPTANKKAKKGDTVTIVVTQERTAEPTDPVPTSSATTEPPDGGGGNGLGGILSP